MQFQRSSRRRSGSVEGAKEGHLKRRERDDVIWDTLGLWGKALGRLPLTRWANLSYRRFASYFTLLQALFEYPTRVKLECCDLRASLLVQLLATSIDARVANKLSKNKQRVCTKNVVIFWIKCFAKDPATSSICWCIFHGNISSYHLEQGKHYQQNSAQQCVGKYLQFLCPGSSRQAVQCWAHQEFELPKTSCWIGAYTCWPGSCFCGRLDHDRGVDPCSQTGHF